MVLARSLRGLSTLGAMGKQDLYFLRLRAENIRAFIVDLLFGLENGGEMTLKAANIYLANLKQKVKGGFGLCSDGLPYDLVLNVFPTTVLLGLGIDRGP